MFIIIIIIIGPKGNHKTRVSTRDLYYHSRALRVTYIAQETCIATAELSVLHTLHRGPVLAQQSSRCYIHCTGDLHWHSRAIAVTYIAQGICIGTAKLLLLHALHIYHRVEFVVGCHPCSTLGSLVFLPTQKPTFSNF